MSPSTLEAFHDTLKQNYKELRANRDLDNLKVLRNRIATIVENNAQKFSDRELQKVRKIRKLLHKINATIETLEEEMTEPIELIDVVHEVRDKYKHTPKLKGTKKSTHILIPVKK